MKQAILNITNDPSLIGQLDTVLSFRPFCDFLNSKLISEETIKSDLYNFIIKKFNQYPELENLDLKKIGDYPELLELIYTGLTGITSHELFWALTTPDVGSLFYGTDTIFDLLKEAKFQFKNNIITNTGNENKRLQLSFIYSTILERFYQFSSIIKGEIIEILATNSEGILKYYEMTIDATFIDVNHDVKLPTLDFRELEAHISDNNLLEYLDKVLPLNLFSFKGFGVIRFHDRTEELAVKKIKESVVNSSVDMMENPEIMEAMKALAGNRLIDFRFTPFIKLNDNFITDFSDTLIPGNLLLSAIEGFNKKPKPVFHKNVNQSGSSSDVLISKLKEAGIASYALFPLFYNNQLTGVLEVFTKKEALLNESILSRVDTALPHLAQFMRNVIDDFNSKMVNIVYENFTSIQPSVQWKFKDASWHYLQSIRANPKSAEIEIVDFKGVFPLYGSIDVRNFSVERTMALLGDFRIHLEMLIELLTLLKPNRDELLLNKLLAKCTEWIEQLNDTFDDDKKQKLTGFIEKEVQSILRQLKATDSAAATLVDNYLEALDERKGKIHTNRRNLESSLQMITKVAGNYLEVMNEDFQKVYPSYFDKFRSDGVEYDIYIGQSINPAKTFEDKYLNDLRLLQLKSMVEIYKLVNRLELPKELHITQLIFINGEPIDIYFRKDEKRFDVEGTYNIRYQMIKKRIDKVHLMNSDERLTQVGKIAMVYLNKKDAEGYHDYIHTLQKENLLNDDLEDLELEELQGVQGLRALRVGIKIDEKP